MCIEIHTELENIRCLIEEKVGNNLKHAGAGDVFLKGTTIVQALRSTISKWDLLKLKAFYKAKDPAERTKRQPIQWEKIFTKCTSDRGLIFKRHK